MLAWYVTEQRPNTYPRLPVREGENVVVWFAAFPDAESADACLAALPRADHPETMTLVPTVRSRLR